MTSPRRCGRKRRRSVEHLVGTMIEVPRAALRADEIADVADFFSFGTNDLTQTTFAFSRDDAEGKFLHALPGGRVLERNPFEVARRRRCRRTGSDRRRARSRREAGAEARHLRRARRRPRSIAFCHELGLDYVSCSPFRVRSRASPPRRRRSRMGQGLVRLRRRLCRLSNLVRCLNPVREVKAGRRAVSARVMR